MRQLQIRSLDKKISAIRQSDIVSMPIAGWVNAIRTALGMTLEQLARRTGKGTNASRIKKIEEDELSGSLTLKTLKSVAAAMNSELVYAIVPKNSIELMVINQYQKKESKIRNQVGQHMVLEDQEVKSHDFSQKKMRLEDINFKGLWND
jgi:predicted DNA-binding mobile mystery protein A